MLDTLPPASLSRDRAFAYWIATLILASECIVGGVLGALRLPPFSNIIAHLGYPEYFMTILGVWYVAAGIVLLLPRLARLKEWAYVGLVFNYTGAAASHVAVHDSVIWLLAPFLFTGLTLASWWLRPQVRP